MSTYHINRMHRNCAACLLMGLPLSGAYAAPQVNQEVKPSKSEAIPSPAKQNKTKTPSTAKPNSVSFGDVQITGFDGNDIEDNFTKFTYTVHDPSNGQVRVESNDKKRRTQMVVFADHVVGQQQQKGHEVIDFTGHVHYTLTETILKKVEGGTRPVERVVTGSAHSAHYTASNKKLRLSSEVDAKIVDADRFDGPATLHVDDLTLENLEKEDRYLLKGDPNTTDIRFTPHVEPPKLAVASTAASKSDKKSSQDKIKKVSHAPAIGMVHVHHFANGVFLTGQNMAFDGPLVTIETVNSAEKSQNTLKAPHIKANLVKEQQSFEATGGIHFDSRSTLVKNAKSVTQILAGTADQATWKQDKPLEVNGNIEATLTNSDMLMEPATLSATHLTAGLGDNPKYIVTGAEAKTRLTFWPRPLPTHKEGDKNQEAVKAAVVQPVAPAIKIDAPDGQTDSKSGRRSDQEDINKDVNKDIDQDADADAQNSTRQSTSANSTPFAFGRIVVTKFQTATYEPDKNLIVEGTKVDFTSTDPPSNSFAELQTPRFEADFDVKNNTVRVARATKNVNYKFQQLHQTGVHLEAMTGKGRAVTFTNTLTNGQQSQIVKVEGVDASDIVNKEGKGVHLSLNSADSQVSMVYDLITHVYHQENPLKQAELKADAELLPVHAEETDRPTPKKTKKKK